MKFLQKLKSGKNFKILRLSQQGIPVIIPENKERQATSCVGAVHSSQVCLCNLCPVPLCSSCWSAPGVASRGRILGLQQQVPKRR